MLKFSGTKQKRIVVINDPRDSVFNRPPLILRYTHIYKQLKDQENLMVNNGYGCIIEYSPFVLPAAREKQNNICSSGMWLYKPCGPDFICPPSVLMLPISPGFICLPIVHTLPTSPDEANSINSSNLCKINKHAQHQKYNITT